VGKGRAFSRPAVEKADNPRRGLKRIRQDLNNQVLGSVEKADNPRRGLKLEGFVAAAGAVLLSKRPTILIGD